MDRVSRQGIGSRPRGFARLVNRAYTTPPQSAQELDSPVGYWLAQAEAMLARDRGAKATLEGESGDIALSDTLSDIELEREFTACARLLYALRVRVPMEAEYRRREAADPAFAAGMDVKAKEIFERLNVFKLEIMNRTRIGNAEEQREVDEVWNGLRRDLRLEDDAQPDPEGALSVSEEHSQGLGHHIQAAENTHPALASSAPSRNEPGVIPDEAPSPRSYWIDLHPIEDYEASSPGQGQDSGFIPVEPPVPLSHWIDLFPIEAYGSSVPEIPPEPSSLFLELHRLDDAPASSAPEVPPSPTGVSLELHEFHD